MKKYEDYINDDKMLRSYHARLPLVAFYYEGEQWNETRENAKGTVFNRDTKELVSLPSRKKFEHNDALNTEIGFDPSSYDKVVIEEDGESAFSFFYEGKVYWKKTIPFSSNPVQLAWDTVYGPETREKDKNIFKTHTLSVTLSDSTDNIILYSVRNIESGKELDFKACSKIAKKLGFVMPGTIEAFSFQKLVELARADFLRNKVVAHYPSGERVRIIATKPSGKETIELLEESWLLSWLHGEESEQVFALETQERAAAIAFFAELDEYSFNILEGIREDYAERISGISSMIDKVTTIVEDYDINYVPIAMNLLNGKRDMESVVRKAVFDDCQLRMDIER